MSLTCKQHGRSSCIALVHVAITCCGPSHRLSPRSTHEPTMWGWHVMDRLLALPGDPHEQEVGLNLASLPMRIRGLGLRRVLRMAPATYSSSWGDALHMIDQRLPEVAASVIRKLTAEEDPGGCFQELRDATAQLDREGFIGRPHWHQLRTGIRAKIVDSDPGEWPHGWQHYASSSSEKHSFSKNVVLKPVVICRPTHLRSHSGQGASEALSPPSQSSALRLNLSEPSFWKDFDCLSRCLKQCPNAGPRRQSQSRVCTFLET